MAGVNVCVWHSDKAGGWRWDTSEDSGGFDRVSPSDPFGSLDEAQRDARRSFPDAVFFDGLPDHYEEDDAHG